MTALQVRLFGQFDVRLDGEPIEIRSQPSQLLLAYLLLNREKKHRRERVAGLLWPESNESNARSNLRHALYKLNKALGEEFFVSDRSTLTFNTGASYEFDVQRLENSSYDIDELLAIVSVYQGELLPGFYDEWVDLERERLQAVFERKMNQLLEGLVEAGRWDDCLAWGERWIARGQTPEPAYRALMLAHSRSGDSAGMAAAYQRAVEDLEEALAVGPSAETQQLYQELKQAEAPHLDVKSVALHNLPAQVTSFVGREQQLAELSNLLLNHDTRLVTLTGPGGVGKTRLGVQAAYDLVEEFEHGLHFVNLVPIRDPERVVPTIAASLGLAESANQPAFETLIRFLKSRTILLFLDNFEQVIEAASEMAALLAEAPHVKLLVTSREGLRIYGETEYPVPTLAISSSAENNAEDVDEFPEATRLFLERTGAVRRNFEKTPQNLRDIDEICVHLDGLPLAIELAAARTKLYSPQALLAELERSFDALQIEARGVDEKNRTLRATIEWSYNLLEEHEKTLFARLSVFRGGHTIEAAREICQQDNAPIDIHHLESLYNKSLLVRSEGPLGEPRFGMLETIHEYAVERLAESGKQADVQLSHAMYYTAFAEEAAPKLRGPEQSDWFNLLEADYDNLLVVLQWSFLMGGDPVFGLRITAALRDFWYYQGHSIEGMYWVGHGLEFLEDAPPEVQGSVLVCAGHMFVLHDQDMEQAKLLYRQSLEIHRQLGDQANIAWSLIWLGYCHVGQPDLYDEARSFANDGLDLFREIDHEVGMTQAFNVLGELARVNRDLERAESAYLESLELCRRVGDRRRESMILTNLAFLKELDGDYDRAEELILDSTNLAFEIDARYMMMANLAAVAGIAAQKGDVLRAARLIGATDSAMETLSTVQQPADQVEFDRYEASVRRQLSDEAYEGAYAAGRAMSMEAAIDYALNPEPQSKSSAESAE